MELDQLWQKQPFTSAFKLDEDNPPNLNLLAEQTLGGTFLESSFNRNLNGCTKKLGETGPGPPNSAEFLQTRQRAISENERVCGPYTMHVQTFHLDK